MTKKPENTKLVTRNEFREFYDEKIANRYKKPDSNSTFEFSDDLIKKLPFCKEPIDLFNRAKIIDVNNNIVKKAILVLRINKTKKTFYLKYNGKNIGKIATWVNNKTNRSYFKESEANVREALKRAAIKARNEELKNPDVAHIANLTIKQYLEQQYKADRLVYKISNGSIKPVKDNVIKTITSDITPLLNEKIKNIKESWIDVLIDYWDTEKPHPTHIDTVCVKAKRTQRKAYTQINSMFNICVKAGYIAANLINGNTGLFKDIQEEEIEINTIDLDADTALKYIFEKAKGSFQGKILLASMMMGGFRNCEVYRNYVKNYKIKAREVFVPAHITDKTNKSRTVPIENDYYWLKVKEYLNSSEYLSHKNEADHLLPMKGLASKKRREKEGNGPFHSTDAIKKPVWTDFKQHFGIEDHIVPYDFRHTFGTNVADELDIHYGADLLGDNLDTYVKHYRKKDLDKKARPSLAKFQSSRKSQIEEAPQTAHDNAAIVLASKDAMPKSITKIFDMFKNGKVVPQENHLLKSDWDKFVTLIKAQKEGGMLEDPMLDLWLSMQ